MKHNFNGKNPNLPKATEPGELSRLLWTRDYNYKQISRSRSRPELYWGPQDNFPNALTAQPCYRSEFREKGAVCFKFVNKFSYMQPTVLKV